MAPTKPALAYAHTTGTSTITVMNAYGTMNTISLAPRSMTPRRPRTRGAGRPATRRTTSRSPSRGDPALAEDEPPSEKPPRGRLHSDNLGAGLAGALPERRALNG